MRYSGSSQDCDLVRWRIGDFAAKGCVMTALKVCVFAGIVFVATAGLAGQSDAKQTREAFLAQYKGTPYEDARHAGGAQAIPGKVYCAYYDRGGEGVAYHDSDAKNNGSGALNPADGTYLNEFRMNEGVDTSYTKFGKDPQIDDTEFDRVKPPADLLYVGWTVPGEWFNITVVVKKAGWYAADLLYTSNRGGAIALDVNGAPATGPLTIESTYDAKDPVAWRQWHHWNVAPRIAKVKLERGRNVITVQIVAEGQMNLAYFDFKPAE